MFACLNVACWECFVLGVGSTNHSLAPRSQESHLHLTAVPEYSVPTVHHQTSSPLTLDLAREISQMVRDVYSEKEVAFAPVFNVKQTKAYALSGNTVFRKNPKNSDSQKNIAVIILKV